MFLSVFLVQLAALAQFASAAADVTQLEEAATMAAVSQIAPSVVKIETIGGLERVGRVLVSTAPTTGLIVDPDGFIISSAFNFVQQPASILVTLSDGTKAAAEIVARDNSRMLVLLKIDLKPDQKLPVPPAVPRAEMRVGQWTIAVGRSMDSETPNISVGILSARDRIWGRADPNRL